MMNVEQKASALLLDMGVELPLRPFCFLGLRINRHLTLKSPFLGDIVAIANIYLSMDIDIEELDKKNKKELLEWITKNAIPISRIVARSIIRGKYLSRMLIRPLAWYLRKRVSPVILFQAWYALLDAIDLRPFITIIRQEEKANPMKPLLSQEMERS